MSGAPGGGGSSFKLSDRLSNEHRACLLRAARTQLLKLKDEHDALMSISGDGPAAQAAADSAALDLHCLQAAVAWLWRDQLAGDG